MATPTEPEVDAAFRDAKMHIDAAEGAESSQMQALATLAQAKATYALGLAVRQGVGRLN